MKLFLLISGLAVVVSMGLVVMIFSMERTHTMISPGLDQLGFKLRKVGALLEDRDFLRQMLQSQVDKQQKLVKELDVELISKASERDEKSRENGDCQVEKTKKNEDLAAVEKDKAGTEATEKTEREAWTAEVQTLKKLQEEPSKVCDFVKYDPKAEKLCPGLKPPAPPAAEKPAAPAAEQPAAPAAEKPAAPAAEQPAAPAAEKPAAPAAEQPAAPAAEKPAAPAAEKPAAPAAEQPAAPAAEKPAAPAAEKPAAPAAEQPAAPAAEKQA